MREKVKNSIKNWEKIENRRKQNLVYWASRSKQESYYECKKEKKIATKRKKNPAKY